MPYTKKTNISPIMKKERKLLSAGFLYFEIAKTTREKIGTIKERNRLIYRVNLRDAFRARIKKEGIKNRNTISLAFGNWFSGYFDGEGCFTIFYRERNGIPERRVGIQIGCRYDDAKIIKYIHKTFGIGVIWQSKMKGTTNPAINWRVERASDLTEVILPVFDIYPLRSKKRLEYQIWRTLVINQYVNTLGGTSMRVGATKKENVFFKSSIERIRKIRHPIFK